jgi:hypothetical protein
VSALFLKNHTLRAVANLASVWPLLPLLIAKRFGRSGRAITLHVKGVLPIDAQMPAHQGRKVAKLETDSLAKVNLSPAQITGLKIEKSSSQPGPSYNLRWFN